MTTAAADELISTLLSPEGRADPYPSYRRLHAIGPVLAIGGGALVLGYAAADQALREHSLVVEGARYADVVLPGWRAHPAKAVLNESMLFVDGVTHHRMRRLASRAFSTTAVDTLRPTIGRLVDELLDRLAAVGAAGEPVDFMGEFAFQLPVGVICRLLGLPDSDRPGLRRPIDALSRALDPGWAHADLSAADRAGRILSDYFADVLAFRRRRPGSDLVSAMLHDNQQSGGPLSDAELIGNLVLLLLAGFETTTNLLGNGLALLGERPALRRLLRAEPPAVPGFVDEVLRYDSPVQLTSRRAATDLRVGPIGVPAGGTVIVLIAAANRDPLGFPDPDTFDVRRAGPPPLSFGRGPHTCLGARLARAEAQLAFGRLLRRFPQLRLAGRPSRLDRFNLRGFATLPIAVGA
jgi:cytochrome P450